MHSDKFLPDNPKRANKILSFPLNVVKILRSGNIDQTKPFQINDFIYLSEGASNSYLIETSEGNILINTGLGVEAPIHKYCFDQVNDKKIKNANVLVLGVTFKEDCPDLRNTKVVDIIDELNDYEINVDVYDPWVDPKEEKLHYKHGINANPFENDKKYDAIIVAVEHKQFIELTMDEYKNISCNFYDELESASVKKVLSTIVYINDRNEKVSLDGLIVDFKIFDKTEYLILKDGQKIRLDKIILFNKL